MRYPRSLVVVLVLLAAGCACFAAPTQPQSDPAKHKHHRQPQNGWSVELFTGTAYNFRTPLTISQAGQPDLDFTATYHTRPFSDSPYYAWRIGKWKHGHAWELEMIHHKVYLTNNPAEVQRFEISHGYNLLLINRADVRGGLIYHLGVGAVVAHTESTVRGESHDTGYHFTGPAGQAAVGKRFALTEKLFATVEGKITAANARVDVANGHAKAPNIALHGLVGLGYTF